MTWRNPENFFVLIPTLMLVIYLWAKRKHGAPSLQFSSVASFKKLSRGLRLRLIFLPDLLKIIALLFVVAALARPQTSSTEVKRNVEGIDIMLVIDISDSMLIEDMPPHENRIESAKQVMRDFVAQRVSDRIGLIIFSGESYTRVPPTLDYKLLLQSLKDVKITRTIKMGTAIGVGLANAVARLRDSTAKSRIVVFLTDGENNTGTISPETAIDIAKGYGIRVYSIGIGKDGESQLPIISTDAFGRVHKTYQPIHSTVNHELLATMAQETGGKSYKASDGDALEKVFKEINQLEKTKVEVNQFTRFTELYQNYLRWGLFFYLLSFFLGQVVLRRVP